MDAHNNKNSYTLLIRTCIKSIRWQQIKLHGQIFIPRQMQRRIRMFWGHPVRGTDPDPSYHQVKIVRKKTLIPAVL